MDTTLKAFTATLFCCLLFASCRKDDKVDMPAEGAWKGKVKSVYSETMGARNYKYDNQGRVASITTPAAITAYQYKNDTIVNITCDTQLIHCDTQFYVLNSQGLLASWAGIAYTYSNDGYLVRSDGPDANTYATYNYSDGNLINYFVRQGATIIGGSRSFLTDKTDNRDYGMAFRGKGSKNLVYIDSCTMCTPVRIVTYFYEYDNQGRVTRESYSDTSQKPQFFSYYQ